MWGKPGAVHPHRRAGSGRLRLLLQPLLEHHQDPHHVAVVAGMLRQQFVDELPCERRPHDAAPGQRVQRIGGKAAQPGVPRRPHAEGQAEALLLVGDGLFGEKAA